MFKFILYLTLSGVGIDTALAEDYTGLSKVVINSSQGKINVISSPSETVSLKVNRSKVNGSCVFDLIRAEKLLSVEAIQKNTGLDCAFEFSLAIPKSLHFDVRLLEGSIDVDTKFASSVLELDSGSITINGGIEVLQIKGKKAKVDFTGTSRELYIDLEVGPVVISYTSMPDSGSLMIDLKSGDVELKIPNSIEVSGIYSPRRYEADLKTKYGYRILSKAYDGKFSLKRN